MEQTKTDSIFRKTTMEKVSSPERLSDYLRVTNLGVWAVLAVVLLLLAGLLVWASVGTLETTAEVRVIVHVNSATTLNVYSHVTDQMRKQAAEKIDAGIVACEAPGGDLPRVPSEDEKVPAAKPFEPFKGTRRKPGTGCLHQINDHLWEGKYSPRSPDGKRIYKNVYASTKEECEEKLQALIVEMNRTISERN